MVTTIFRADHVMDHIQSTYELRTFLGSIYSYSLRNDLSDKRDIS